MPPRKKKAQAGTVGLAAADVAAGEPPAEVRELAGTIDGDGGRALASYREPYGGKWVVFAALPLEKVQATPYQRELSQAHADRLAAVIPKVGRYLDPIVAVRHDGGYWTPNGMHRLEAMRQLGARALTALVVPDQEVAFRILALNTEKAHNLKDKSLEVIRMARGLAATPDTANRPEADWAFEFEEPAYLTVGLCYEERGRFSGGAYLPVLKRCEEFSTKGIRKSIEERGVRAKRVLELDDAVNDAVQRLKDAGFTSGYLKPFVVARVNPLRFVRAAKPGQKAPRAEFEATIQKMIDGAKKLDAGKVKPADLAVMGGGAPAEE